MNSISQNTVNVKFANIGSDSVEITIKSRDRGALNRLMDKINRASVGSFSQLRGLNDTTHLLVTTKEAEKIRGIVNSREPQPTIRKEGTLLGRWLDRAFSYIKSIHSS